MFFLKLEGDDLERLLKLAAEKKGTPVERLARLAFLKGLRLLAKADAETVATEVSAEKRPYKRRKPLEEIQAYIRANWEQQTDAQMGEASRYGGMHIRRIRLDMGLMRKKGRPPISTTAPPSDAAPSPKQLRRQQLDTLIHAHWETKDDWEIGRLTEPHVAGSRVRLRRYALGLKKVQGTKRNNTLGDTIRNAIAGEEFERMVLREGYTMTEYKEFKHLPCTRERLRQVAEQLGLKHSPEDRAPEWKLMRRARKVGHLNLANREWLANKITHYQSMAALAAELQVEDSDLFFFIRSFKLSHPSLRKHGAETVNFVCTKCGTEFTRLKKWVGRRRTKAIAHPQEFFCSQSCSGQWNRERVKRRIEEKSAKQLERERIRAEKRGRRASFIRENWQSMSDAQLALALELSEKSVAMKRAELGFRRA